MLQKKREGLGKNGHKSLSCSYATTVHLSAIAAGRGMSIGSKISIGFIELEREIPLLNERFEYELTSLILGLALFSIAKKQKLSSLFQWWDKEGARRSVSLNLMYASYSVQILLL